MAGHSLVSHVEEGEFDGPCLLPAEEWWGLEREWRIDEEDVEPEGHRAWSTVVRNPPEAL